MLGVEHCDDTIYLLVRNDVAPLITREQPEWQMIDVMTQLWGNFIKAGYSIGLAGIFLTEMFNEYFN